MRACLRTVSMFAALSVTGTALPSQADVTGQGDALSRIIGHFGKTLVLPTKERVVFYVRQDEIWHISRDGRIIERGEVEVQPRPDWRLELHWFNGDLDVLDATNADEIIFLNETPLILTQLQHLQGEPVSHAVGPLPEGAQLLAGGLVVARSGEVIGDWEVRTTGIGLYLTNQPLVVVKPEDLIAALPATQAKED